MWGILLCFRGTLGEISGEKMLMIEKEMQLSDRNAALLPGGDVSRAGSRQTSIGSHLRRGPKYRITPQASLARVVDLGVYACPSHC